MIIFAFDTESTNDSLRLLYWLSCTSCIAEDKEHTNEIYEQLDAQACGLTDEI